MAIDTDSGLRKSPFRLKPGAFVELNTFYDSQLEYATSLLTRPTTSCISLAILSLSCAQSFLTLSIKARIFLCISSGVKPSCPIAMRTTPNLSLYSLPPTRSLTEAPTSLTTVPSFALGMRPLGPSIRATPALLSACNESTWQMSLSNSILPSLTASKMTWSPAITAPDCCACLACLELGGHITAMRSAVLTG